MSEAAAEMLRDRARKDWDNESVGKCPNPEHVESTHEAEKACPYCSKLIELCQKGVP
jgi:hypothetical protein